MIYRTGSRYVNYAKFCLLAHLINKYIVICLSAELINFLIKISYSATGSPFGDIRRERVKK